MQECSEGFLPLEWKKHLSVGLVISILSVLTRLLCVVQFHYKQRGDKRGVLESKAFTFVLRGNVEQLLKETS